MKRLLVICFLIIWIGSGCNSSVFEKKSMNSFYGIWELTGRSILNGIQVEIKPNEKGELQGRVVQLNENELVQLFMNRGDVLIKRIKRKSNYQFKIVEKKLASTLFSLYDMDTEQSYIVKFETEDFISFSKSKRKINKIGYKRVR